MLFVFAVIAFVVRSWIRFRVLKQFAIEDAIIIFAMLCLTAVTALDYVSIQNLYDVLAVILYGFGANLLSVLETIETEAKMVHAMSTMWWLVLFPIKLAYLLFFRKLIDRLPRLKIYWWCVVAFLVGYGGNVPPDPSQTGRS